MEKFKVTILPKNITVEVAKDTSVLSAAISAGIYLKSACGGDGVCGQCKIILKSGSLASQVTGRLSVQERQKNIYLACLTEIRSDIVIDIPQDSLLDFEKLSKKEMEERLKGIYSEPEDLEPLGVQFKERLFTHAPLASKIYLEMSPPNLDDKISDLERLHRQVRKVSAQPLIPCINTTNLSNIRVLSELLRDSDWKVTVTIAKKGETCEILTVQPQNTSKQNYGVCFDIGTTTISGQLIDLASGKVLSSKAAYNKQASFGSDIISRIIYAGEPEGLEKLHLAVSDEMNEMISDFSKECKIDLNDVNYVVCAGNTTMMHLLLEINPSFIRKEPYVSTANFLPVIKASEAGIKINPHGLLFCIPGVSSYVGADTVAGVLATGIDEEEDLCLLIDIGTNGEIVLGNKDFLVSCAASAGPAFEGSGVECGMRAAKGAIQKVKIDPKDYSVNFSTIGEEKAKGICGSGYIDLISELLKTGIIDKAGKIKVSEHKRIRTGPNGKEFVVATKDETAIGADIFISEADIENLKRAKAAIYSAIKSLTKHLDCKLEDIKKIFVAGGFGTYLDIDKSIEIGLLPDIRKSRYLFIGNSSLNGAKLTLLSYEACKKTEEIANKMTYIELSAEPSYMDEYMAALFFPHTDLNLFPSLTSNKK